MGKLRIILAETEETVLAGLEYKFLYELRDTADLEIISDENYFREFFSTQQKADILVCGQNLYSKELKRHDIGKVFVLCEDTSSGRTAELDIERVNKYSNPKAVMDQILSGTSLGRTKNDPIIVLTYSANGGAGKTTVAMGICAAMVKDFKRVLYINAERINTFQNKLHAATNIPNALINELSNPGKDIYQKMKHVIRKDGFDYLPPFSHAISSMGLPFSVYEKFAESAKESKDYDVIVIDTDSVFDEQKASLISKADRVVIIVNQTRASLFAANSLLSNLNCNDTTKYFFVCNAFSPDKKNALLSTEEKPRFVVSENIAYIDEIESLELSQLAQRGDIQKTAYLLI